MTFDRRSLLSFGLGAGVSAGLLPTLGTTGAAAAPAAASRQLEFPARAKNAAARIDALLPNASADQTGALQDLIDRAAEHGDEIVLPSGRFRTRTLQLRAGTRIRGSGTATVLELSSSAMLFSGTGVDGVSLKDFTLDGTHHAPATNTRTGLISLKSSRDVMLARLQLHAAGSHGLLLEGCSGHVSRCRIGHAADAGIFAIDSTGLTLSSNAVTDCGNNGIMVWRSVPGEDGTQVNANHIARISASNGGTGQNGNGINVFRAASVSVNSNRITDCAYSAIRGNAASNLQIVGNACVRLGEVAIYAEFGFEGALIASNSVDTAATGISVTNFNVGGRLAVIQGNLIRNLQRREHEAVDKRGEGIVVEADATITGNTIENAPTAGIVIGWGRHMRDCLASGNLIRHARVGIMVSDEPGAEAAFVTANMISGATDGAIRAHRHGLPFGPDLAQFPIDASRIKISGNMAL